ncbi:MAG: ATP-grasp domain-containing protein [Polyangiaceae bacterium]|nr:ATP-grasp domain-containing protein [Polyangiaceae bacterium]
MDTISRTLIIPEKSDPERDAVAAAWESCGGTVLRLGRFWDPPAVDRRSIRVYGNGSFCLVLEQKLDLALISPADDLLTKLGFAFLGRRVATTTTASMSGPFPAFVKSLIPKQIRSRLYLNGADLAVECEGLEPDTGLLVSEPIDIVAEARSFIVDANVLDCALYEGSADLAAARAFAVTVARESCVPKAVVLDVALLRDGRWVVIEFNAAWGAGLNGCDPMLVLPAIDAATTTAEASDPGRAG